jgi:hypothetical protein
MPVVTVHHPIVLEISKLTKEMIDWYHSVGGVGYEDEHWDHRGNRKTVTFVRYGSGKFCHHRKDGTGGVRLHFNGEHASIATMFIMQFPDFVEQHNIREVHFN